MCWRRLCTRVDVQTVLSPIQLSRVLFTFHNTADNTSREVTANGGHARLQQQHKLFRRLLRHLQGDKRSPTLMSSASAAVSVEVAIPRNEPLAANAALMEQLGVMDLAERRTVQFAVPNTTGGGCVMSAASLASNFTEACRAGVKCQLPPIVVLRKVLAAVRREKEENTTINRSALLSLYVPSVAVAVLYRAATARLLAMIKRSDEEEGRTVTRRLPKRWVLAEEVRRTCELLSALDPQQRDSEEQHSQQQQQWWREEMRERLKLAAAVQNGAVAMDALERLLAFHEKHNNNNNNSSSTVNVKADYLSLAQEFGFAISAFRLTRDFGSAVILWEKFLAITSQQKNVVNIENGNGNPAVEAADIAAENLKVLTHLADCIDANAAHFTYVRDIVLHLFTSTDVGYYATTREVSQKAFCALLHALSRVTLETRARMDAAQSFFRAVQLSSHADVSISPNVTEALLQVASAARDGSTALLLYNQLSAPNVCRADVSANIIAVLLAEKDALNDLERYVSFVSMRRRAIVSSAAHLLAVKLLLQQQEEELHQNATISDAVYTVLDLIDSQHEVEPQRTFFLRLLVLHIDLHRILQRRQQNQQEEEDKVLEKIKSDPRWGEHAQSILQSWREELYKRGVTTTACTTLQLLQRIRQQFIDLDAVYREEKEGITTTETSTVTLGKGISSLISCIDSILFDFSLGWLRHRASAERTPRFHLPVAELQYRIMREDTTEKPVKALCYATLGLTDVTKRNPVECRKIVLETFNKLRAAGREGNMVVLGFSDYVRLCSLEDTSMMCTECTTSAMEPASIDKFCFSLDSMNNYEPPLYVTDALGELQLQKALHSETGVQCIESIDMSKLDSLMNDNCHNICSRIINSTIVGKWLTAWLAESFVFQPVVRGIFERQLELLLRTVPLSTASVTTEGDDKPIVTEPTVDEESTVLQWFVSVR
ncbi:hypothetical protein LSM04_000128 [Trypanosoma melophagium]|uniref:uncharacterized protein n=1 Tax=Trypanosoma melophagium TaxID=715481 RepID=UPI00351A3AF7|nr:hypothetical protein LSM04_000128 [Trypanosoma melophagium]